MARGITVTTHLVSGDTEGISKSYLSNWTGQAVKIPRNLFFDTKDFPELNRPGVYFLIGPKYDKPDDILIYIGEGNHLFERISVHMKDEEKSFFETIIVFSSKDDSISVSHTKYLETKIITEIFEKSGYTLVNKRDGNRISLSLMVKDETDTYFDNMKILLPHMGYDLFKPVLKNIKQPLVSDNEKLTLEVTDIKAYARLTANGILVLKDSLFKETPTSSLSPGYLKIRNDLLAKGYVKRIENVLKFVQEYEFTSPSQAAAVIMGYPVNGRVFWKNGRGKSLNDIEKEKIRSSNDEL